MKCWPCPYLKGDVELTEERERHIARRHPDLLPHHMDKLGETLAEPDHVRRSTRFAAARLFSRWYTDVHGGKHVVVVVVSQTDSNSRHWIITAYLARSLVDGEPLWSKD